MKVTWLGQAGLLFESKGVKIMVDPYLSDSVKEIQPHFWRRVPVDEAFFEVKPDVIYDSLYEIGCCIRELEASK